MTKRMLIDATHAEETRVVVLDGNRLEDFDVETSTKRQLKGNIYLAKVVRVEPSLQAAFVEYGGNRHGFLAFGEIHPDYYQIPIADRQRLIEAQAEEARREEEAEDRAAAAEAGEAVPAADVVPSDDASHDTLAEEPGVTAEAASESQAGDHPVEAATIAGERVSGSIEGDEASTAIEATEGTLHPVVEYRDEAAPVEPDAATGEAADQDATENGEEAYSAVEPFHEQPPPETVGGEGDGGEDTHERRIPSRLLRNYKIQEVIKRRQILLVQVVKEERGTKGAALTTYISLAGRFGVLMPNSPRGGGISRKITSAADRRRLKEIIAELEIPQGMGLIVRTAGANRPKPEIKRDCEYLLRLWDDIREHTLKSVAPALIYEEASLIKRTIRDVYSRDIDEIQVDGEQGWRAAHEFMRMLMPSHAKKVQLWRDSNGGQPLFAKYQVEAQLDGMLQPVVQLRSGGYLVINQAEALVAIDVNSGRSTRERGIEETALRTNLEAADEVARQLRLRDLAGLIVIDFIDMESKKNNAMVERRLKEALKNDRARIQVGHISHFGLMEMSRQRLRPSLAETSFIACAHCGGTGHVRSTESAAIHVLRGVEEEGAKRRAAEIIVYASVPVALYILNHKRERLSEIEARYAMRVVCLGDDSQMASQFRVDRVKPQFAGEVPAVITQDVQPPALSVPLVEAEEPDVIVEEDEEETTEEAGDASQAVAGETAEEAAERQRRRRRRRRRGGRREEATPATEPVVAGEAAAPEAGEDAAAARIEGVPEHVEAGGEDEHRGRRRGRRGGRRRQPEGPGGNMSPHAAPDADQPDLPPVYIGPTPANPFGGHSFDIFDVLERAEETAAAPAPAVTRQEAPRQEAPRQEELHREEPHQEAPRQEAPHQEEPHREEPHQEAPHREEPHREAPRQEAPHQETPHQETPHQEALDQAARHQEALDREEAPEPEHALVEATSLPAHADAGGAEPLSEPPPEPEPAIKPIVIGNGEAPVLEKKRGWWRR